MKLWNILAVALTLCGPMLEANAITEDEARDVAEAVRHRRAVDPTLPISLSIGTTAAQWTKERFEEGQREAVLYLNLPETSSSEPSSSVPSVGSIGRFVLDSKDSLAESLRKLRNAGARFSNARLDFDFLEGQNPYDLLPLFGEIINQGDDPRLSVYFNPIGDMGRLDVLQEWFGEKLMEAIAQDDLPQALSWGLRRDDGESLVSSYLHNFAEGINISYRGGFLVLHNIFSVPCPMLQPNILPFLTEESLPVFKANLEEKRKGGEKVAVVLEGCHVPAQGFQGIVVGVTDSSLVKEIGKVDLINPSSFLKRFLTMWTPALKKGGAIRFMPWKTHCFIGFPTLPDIFAPLRDASRVDRKKFLAEHLKENLTLEDVRGIVGDFKLCLFSVEWLVASWSPERSLGEALRDRLVPFQLKQLLEEHLWKEFSGLRPQVDFVGNPEDRKFVINLIREDERVLFREVAQCERLTSTVILKDLYRDERERPIGAGDVLEVNGEKRVIIGVEPKETGVQVTFEGMPLSFATFGMTLGFNWVQKTVAIHPSGKYFFPHLALFTEGEWKRGWHVSENRFFVPHGEEAEAMFRVGSTVIIPGVGAREITSYNISRSAEGTSEFAHVGYAGDHIDGDSIPLAPFMLDRESPFINRSPVLWGKGQAEESWKEGIDRKNRLFYVLNTKGNRDAWKVGTDHEVDQLGRVRILEQIDAGETLHLRYEPIELARPGMLFRRIKPYDSRPTSTVTLETLIQDETERPIRAGDVLEINEEKRVIIGVELKETGVQVTFEGTPLELTRPQIVTIDERGRYCFPHPILHTGGEWKRGWHVSENRFFVPHGEEAEAMFKVGSTVVIPGVGPREITSYNISVSAEGTPEFAHVGYAGDHIEGDSVPLAPFMLDRESLFVNRNPVLWGKGEAGESWKEGIDQRNRRFYVLNTQGNRDAWKVGTDHEVDQLGRVRILEQIDAGETLHLRYEPIE